mmetsp:Transcript_27411/g.77363  ORF Transcript_27411/g.77363 Transcript_27411/m.77363 type:complete len:100 (-) Transcript_27411:1627-1926(-)
MAATGGPPVLTDGPPPNPVISITAAKVVEEITRCSFAVAWMKIAMAVSLPNDRYLGFNQIQTCTFSAASCKLSFVSDQLNPRRGIGRCISEMSTWLLSD